MVMKWFTREWHSGGLSDDGVEARRAGYWSHEDAVRSRLPEALQLFAGQPDEIGRADLHDGRVEWWALDGARSFTLQVICGWVQIGYRRLVIQYRGHVELFGASESDVAGWLDDASTELLYDEVDIAADDRLEHRFLRLPRGEFGVRLRMRWWSPRRHRGGRTPGVAPQAIGVARDVRANAPRLGFRSLARAQAVVRPSRGGQSEQLVAGTRELGISQPARVQLTLLDAQVARELGVVAANNHPRMRDTRKGGYGLTSWTCQVSPSWFSILGSPPAIRRHGRSQTVTMRWQWLGFSTREWEAARRSPGSRSCRSLAS